MMIILHEAKMGTPFMIKGASIQLVEEHEPITVVYNIMPLMRPVVVGRDSTGKAVMEPRMETVVAPQEVLESIEEIQAMIQEEQAVEKGFTSSHVIRSPRAAEKAAAVRAAFEAARDGKNFGNGPRETYTPGIGSIALPAAKTEQKPKLEVVHRG